jgi:hypothetical protein
LKREEYEYLQDIKNGTQSNFQPTILRPPHADELAHIGTIRAQNPILTYNNGFHNFGYYRDDKDERISSTQFQPSQHWIELQSPMINTSQLPPADYEIHAYPTDDYPYRQIPPRPTIIDFRQYQNDYIDDDDEIENYRLQSFRRPEIIIPKVQRIDTSTEFYGINYTNTMPKSILKSGINTTPPVDLHSTPYLQLEHSRTSSKNDESPRTSVKINTDQPLSTNYPISAIEKRIPIEPILSPTLPLSSKHRMKFANVSQLNDIEWEVPSEFEPFRSNYERTPPTIIDSRTHISWQSEMNISQPNYLLNSDITQQQAFEY